MTTQEIQEAITWHQRRAAYYQSAANRVRNNKVDIDWPAVAHLEESAEAERRNAVAYKTGKITTSVLEGLRTWDPGDDDPRSSGAGWS